MIKKKLIRNYSYIITYKYQFLIITFNMHYCLIAATHPFQHTPLPLPLPQLAFKKNKITQTTQKTMLLYSTYQPPPPPPSLPPSPPPRGATLNSTFPLPLPRSVHPDLCPTVPQLDHWRESESYQR